MAKLKSPGLVDEQKFNKQAESIGLSKDESKAIFFYQDRARKAYEQREKNWEYFDGLTYTQDYYLNRQAANTYLRPKKNDDEVRIATGTTEKKIEVVHNELLNLSLEPDIRAFDENDELMVDLGEQFADVVERTNEIERDSDLWSDSIAEMLTQRAVFIEERWVEENVRDNKKGKIGTRNSSKAQKFLISGLKVFLGDITIPWYRFNDQPYIIKYDRVSWKKAQKMFGDMPNWKYVNKSQPMANSFGIFDLRIGSLEKDEVEILTYMSYNDDEYIRLVNSVPMDPVGSPLPWEYEGYNMKMFGLKTMSRDFAYNKPLTASAKTLQALDNESIRLLIRKFRQAIDPPLGTKSGKVFSKDIFSPSAVTQGLTEGEFTKLIDHQGVTQSEFNMIEFFERKASEFIGAGNLQQGIGEQGQQTATEITQLQKQAAVQLGLGVLGVINMKRDMTYLRLFNLLEHVAKPIGKEMNPLTEKIQDVFLQYTRSDADLGEGRRGEKKIVFSDTDVLPTLEDEEKFLEIEESSRKKGKDIRFFFINVKKLMQIPINWFVTVNQSFKDSDALDKVLFNDSFQQAMAVSQVSGRPLNGDAIVQDFGQTWKRKDWFQREAPQNIAPALADGAPGQTEPGSQLTPQKEQKPGINSLLGNA